MVRVLTGKFGQRMSGTGNLGGGPLNTLCIFYGRHGERKRVEPMSNTSLECGGQCSDRFRFCRKRNSPLADVILAGQICRPTGFVLTHRQYKRFPNFLLVDGNTADPSKADLLREWNSTIHQNCRIWDQHQK